MARSTDSRLIGGSSMSPSRYSRLENPCFLARAHRIAVRSRQTVINVLSAAAITDHTGPLQLREVTGNTRLAHGHDLLQLSDREFFLLEQREQAQPGGIGQKPEKING